MAKNNVCLFDENGEVQINYINFEDIKNQGYKDYQMFLDTIKGVEGPHDSTRY
jgi:hypothetical protein